MKNKHGSLALYKAKKNRYRARVRAKISDKAKAHAAELDAKAVVAKELADVEARNLAEREAKK